MTDQADKVTRSEAQWRAQLDPEQYRVTREAGTEAPFSGAYCDHEEAGFYHCVCCGHPLFSSRSKFHSGCGWPSFHGELALAGIAATLARAGTPRQAAPGVSDPRPTAPTPPRTTRGSPGSRPPWPRRARTPRRGGRSAP